jgi:hypothetical protein
MKCPNCDDGRLGMCDVCDVPNWIRVEDKEPPKENHFLAWDGERQYLATWFWECPEDDKNENGWFFASDACSCCSGYCSIEVKKWMPLPGSPKDGR